MKIRTLICFVGAALVLVSLGAKAAEPLAITEFSADNPDYVLLDEDGDSPDWIEIHNSSTNTINVNGWWLTDKASALTGWRFPSTNMAPNGYLIVFASGKDRRTSGAPLHTDFKIKKTSGFLALVRPDGTTIASSYNPYPVQVEGVSYGIPVEQTTTTLVASGAVARVLVPTDGALATAWTGTIFDDSAWSPLGSGIGYESGAGPFTPVTYADSVAEFSNVQGQNNWFYGYWRKDTDANGVYADSEFVPFPAGYWNGTAWDWPAGDPPYTELGAEGGRPSATNGAAGIPTHWPIRRYVSEVDGPLTLRGILTHTSDWVFVRQTATYPSGAAPAVYIYMEGTGVGEGHLDDLKLVSGSVPEVGVNLVANGDFESAALSPPWFVSANVAGSSVSSTIKHSGTKSLRIVSTSLGAGQTTSIFQTNLPGLTAAQTYTLSYWYLPTTNSARLRVRMSGSWVTTTPTYCGDGVAARIFVDGTQVFQQSALVSSANYAATVQARVGSKIDFALDAGAANNDLCDAVTFTALVQTGDPMLALVADSAADWSLTGQQGEKGWFNGYYNRTADADKVYQAANFTPFPRAAGPPSPSNFWDEEQWEWFAGSPPLDRIGQYWMTPNGTNSAAEHWVIRRWVSTISGSATVEWRALKSFPDQYDTGGNGVIVRLFQNGVARDSATVRGGDVAGVQRTVNLVNLQVGDVLDLAIDPTDVSGAISDASDRTFATMAVRGEVSLGGQLQNSIAASMEGVNSSAYLRFPFTVDDPSVFNSLNLRMRFDDGFVAYLNGVEIARANAPTFPAWNSTALAPRSDAAAIQPEEFNITPALGLLMVGDNVMAIHGLNAAANDSDFLILPELLATSETQAPGSPRYFLTPTPGAANGLGTTTLGPLVIEASHTPNIPADNDPITVTARVSPTFNPVSIVRMIYRVMYSNEVNVPMFDDGLHGDGGSGDGVWGATIPTTASTGGQMVRYYIYATDSQANSTRFPVYDDPKNSPQYQGTVVVNPALTNPLPVLHFFVQNPVLATNTAGTRCSIFWDGEFFDNIEVSRHGQTTPLVFAKRSMNFNLNTGHKLQARPGEGRVKAFDLISTAADKAFMRILLSFEAFRDAGVPTHSAFAVRVQQNNAFHSVAHWVEQANDDFLERNGLDPNGALYKMYFPLTNAYSGIHKQTRKNEPNDDLQALINGLNQTGTARRQYMFDNLDIPEVVNFFATIELVQNEDCCYYKNYYLQRDTGRSGEWKMLPWDLDLTLGRTFTGWIQVGGNTFGGYYDTNIYWTNRWFTEQRSAVDFIGGGQPLFEALWAYPDTQNMFLRRWSTVQERLLQKSGTHPLALRFEQRVDALTAQLAPDAALDLAQWGTFPPSAPIVESQPYAAARLKTNYLALRRNWIFNTLAFANGGPYLGSQPTNAVILIGDIDYNPSGAQNREYIQLRNTNNYSVDISGWKLGGGVQHTFRGGTVIPSNSVMYVSPDVNAFRARTIGPRGGQGLFVQGNYQGQISSRGELIQLTDDLGRAVIVTNTPPTPSLAQQYLRITEIMFHPAPPLPGYLTNADEYEYVELKNIGPVNLDLADVRFSAGISFSFGPTSLAPGGTLVVVRNATAFLSRYLNPAVIAGEFTGQLDNMGENLRLDDAAGEKILEFSYSPDWYPIADGFGFSLEIVNDQAAWDSWGEKASWRASGYSFGSPSETNPPTMQIPPVVINEVLTASIAPAFDAIELFNPTGQPANISGWMLTDDYRQPLKYRIQDNTIIPAYGFLVLDESAFNPVVVTSSEPFALSSRGDEIHLFSTDTYDNLTGYRHGYRFGAAQTGVSFGRHFNSVGTELFIAQSQFTPGLTNGLPQVGPAVLSEILYRPPDLAGGTDNSADEFVEVQNITGEPLPLFDAAAPTNTWQIGGGVSFSFPTNVTLAPGAFLIIANFNPAFAPQLASFRARFGVPVNVVVLGPFSGQLDNSADTVTLSKPAPADPAGAAFILIDQVDYKDSTPWPATADGSGASLQRRMAIEFGNDPANWLAAAPSAGVATAAGGQAPFITLQPADTAVAATADTLLLVSAGGAAPLRYQWRFGGAPLPGATNSQLALTSVQLSQAGNYDVTVFNSAGAVTSSNAVLGVFLAAYFTQQPQSQSIKAGTTTNFTALAVSGSAVRYQWRFNGTNLLNATNPTLPLVNVQPANAGIYQVIATDAVASVPSAAATLTVTYEPFFAQQPANVEALSGANVTFSVVVSNTATLPIGYRWRKNGLVIAGASQTLYSHTSFFTATNVTPGNTNYSVVITNVTLALGRSSGATNGLIFLRADATANGLPDNWETNYFGAGAVVDPYDDPDGDKMSNLDEYIAGTDPTNPASFLNLNPPVLGGGASLSFGAVSARTYTILVADLPTGPWSKLADIVARTNNRVETILDPAVATNRFYRVVTPRQP